HLSAGGLACVVSDEDVESGVDERLDAIHGLGVEDFDPGGTRVDDRLRGDGGVAGHVDADVFDTEVDVRLDAAQRRGSHGGHGPCLGLDAKDGVDVGLDVDGAFGGVLEDDAGARGDAAQGVGGGHELVGGLVPAVPATVGGEVFFAGAGVAAGGVAAG